MTARIFLIRHARPIINLATPSYTWPLASSAEAEITPIVAKLEHVNLSRIWSSPELRALSTAKIVGESLGCRVETLAKLSEHKRDSASRPQSDSDFFSLMEQFFDRADQPIFGLETASDALNRFKSAVRFVLSNETDDTVIVTHGTVLSLYLGSISKQGSFQIWQNMEMPDLFEVSRRLIDDASLPE